MKKDFTDLQTERGGTKAVEKTTEDRLKKTGTITVRVQRVKNLCWPSKRRTLPEEAGNIPHRVEKFGKVPEQAVQALGLSHHGREFSVILYIRMILIWKVLISLRSGKRLDQLLIDGWMATGPTKMLSLHFISSIDRSVS